MLRSLRAPAFTCILALVFGAQILAPIAARAAVTTGDITGTITDSKTGAPIANVAVAASAPSGSYKTTSDQHGFYSLINMTPDTYVLSFQKDGYQPYSIAGVTVVEEQTVSMNQQLTAALTTIARVQARSTSNLVNANSGTDVYNISGAQLAAATNPANLHETIYQYLGITPGVTGGGFPAQPRIRGGQVTDLGYQFEGIPIQDRIVGFFTTNLANIGISNISVYTGGLSSEDSFNGTGYFNSVLKTGSFPGFSTLNYTASSPESNLNFTGELGGGTADHKFTYFVGFDYVNSQNQYYYGNVTYPNVLFFGYDGPGPVQTRDWVSNFIWRPTQKDSYQFVFTNSFGMFNFDYLLPGIDKPSLPPALGFVPCAGNVPNPPGSTNTWSGFSGGRAPNGQTCPIGLYWGPQTPGTGDLWFHYGGLGKLEWNHNLNDHSYFNLSVFENFNQYIFDQPIGDANIANLENAGGGWNWAEDLGLPASACPSYPYAVGSPVVQPVGGPGNICAFDDGIQNFFGDRRSNIYGGRLDYEDTVNENLTFNAAIYHEYDNNVFDYFLTNNFNSNGTFPQDYEISTYPTVLNQISGQAAWRIHKLLLVPGLAWGDMHYGYPNGGATVGVWNPTFNGTYAFDPSNVMRFSYGNTASFISSAYVYTEANSLILRNPKNAGTSFNPQLNHSWDLMWEHQFNYDTSMRFGPYWNKVTGYYEAYQPIIGYIPVGCNPSSPTCLPQFSKQTILSNNNRHQVFGAEFGLNHVDNRVRGFSFWLSGTYTNYWTTATALAGAFINSPLPQNLINQGVMVRAFGNPLFSGTILFDAHYDRFHFVPLFYYQVGNPYNIGVISTMHNGVTVAPYISEPTLYAGGWWMANLSLYYEAGRTRNVLLGLKMYNLFNQWKDTAPCQSDGTGCFPFDGPYSGIHNTPGQWMWGNYTQSPFLIYFYGSIRMGTNPYLGEAQQPAGSLGGPSAGGANP